MGTSCCVVGGGPAGMMLGLLLARAGVDVTVLEKHADFFRDFRGDTIHPSTLQLMDELGLLDEFLQLPHSQARELIGRIGSETIRVADFRYVPGRCKFMAIMPQWDFLNFVAERAGRHPSFRLEMQSEAMDLLGEGECVTGVRVKTPQGERTVSAHLVVACDGRESVLRERASLVVQNIGAPIDVLWMRLSRSPDDPGQTFGNVAPGGILAAMDRGTYYQCALVIRKGDFDVVKSRGIEAFREQIAAIAPFLRERVHELTDWDQIKLLTVRIDRLQQWYREGLLCIGDAAHAMSPIGGVGINLAIQDAVAAANILVEPLCAGSVKLDHLRAVQRRREFPTRVTQWVQEQLQERVVKGVLAAREPIAPPAALRYVLAFPVLRAVPAWMFGVGVRPEHVKDRALRGA